MLLLSRNEAATVRLEAVDLSDMIAILIAEHKYLVAGKAIDIEFQTNRPELCQLPKSLCRIVLSNLIRNAFEHSQPGRISIVLHDTRLCITNPGQMTEDERQQLERGYGHGFGIGLDIVKKISQQQDWQFTIGLNHEGQVKSELDFCIPSNTC